MNDKRVMLYPEEVDSQVRPYKVTTVILVFGMILVGIVRWERFTENQADAHLRDCVQQCVAEP